MKKKIIKWQSLILVMAMLVAVIVPAFGTTASAAATHAIDICREDGTSVTEQISLMESEQLQLTHKLLDCSMPDGGYIKWTSEAPLIVSVDSTGKIYAHDSSKGAAVRLWIDNDVRTVAIIGPALAKTMEKILFNDKIDIDTMDTEAIVETVRASMKGIPSNISDYLIKQLEDKLNSLDTGITVTLYSADGEVLASDQVRVLVTNSDNGTPRLSLTEHSSQIKNLFPPRLRSADRSSLRAASLPCVSATALHGALTPTASGHRARIMQR